MNLTEFQEAGYQIQVNYDNTQFMQADVPIAQLAKVDDVDDLDYENDDVLETSYDFGSEQFSIYDREGNCLVDSLFTVENLKEAIVKLPKPGASQTPDYLAILAKHHLHVHIQRVNTLDIDPAAFFADPTNPADYVADDTIVSWFQLVDQDGDCVIDHIHHTVDDLKEAIAKLDRDHSLQ